MRFAMTRIYFVDRFAGVPWTMPVDGVIRVTH
jgi:hypothetical protein